MMRTRDRILIGAEGALLSSLLGMTCVGCLVTGFRLTAVDLGRIGMFCVLTALICSLLFSFKYSRFLPVVILVAALFHFGKNGMLADGLESIVNRVSRIYNAAYGWQILQWSQRTPEMLGETLPLFLYMFGGLVTWLTAWVLIRGHSVVLPLLPACLPVMSCFVVTDTQPKLIWLLLFFAVTVLLMLTSTTRQDDTAHGAYLTAMLIVPVFAAVTVLFYCIPQAGYNRQSQAQALADRLFHETALQEAWEDVTGQSAVVGSSVDGGRVDLTRVGYRQVSRSEVMRINARHTGTMYLRGRALDGYTGTEWHDTQTDPQLPWPEEENLKTIGEVVISTRYAHRMMYLPYYVTSIDMDPVARGVENSKKLAMYSFSCSAADQSVYTRLYPSAQTSATRYVQDLDYTEILTQLPEETAAWAVPLAEKITGAYESPYHKAQAIAQYVRDSAKYNLQTRRMSANSKDFARWFLETGETGYCVHFATAATVLLKAAGIPARYVTGYLVEVADGSTTVVLAENAHAWTEYWLPGFGWVMLEVTPAAVPEETTEPTTVVTPETQTPATPKDETQTTLPVETQPALQDVPETENTPAKWLPVLLWTALGLMAVGILLLQWKLRRMLRQKRCSRGNPNQRALACWQEALLLDRYLNREPDSGLYALAEKARFSQHTLTGEELAQFELYLDSARQQLRNRNIFRRCYYTLILALY